MFIRLEIYVYDVSPLDGLHIVRNISTCIFVRSPFYHHNTRERSVSM